MASAVVASLLPMLLNRPTKGLAFGLFWLLLVAPKPPPWPGGIKKLSITLLGVVMVGPTATANEDDEVMTCVCDGAWGCAGCANT